MPVRVWSVAKVIYSFVCYRRTMERKKERRPTRKRELLNNVDFTRAPIPLFLYNTEEYFYWLFSKKQNKKKGQVFSSSILEAHFIEAHSQEKSLRRGMPSFPTAVFPEEDLQSWNNQWLLLVIVVILFFWLCFVFKEGRGAEQVATDGVIVPFLKL